MKSYLSKLPGMWIGLGLGLLIGLGMMVGTLVGMGNREQELIIPEGLQATASHGSSLMAVATGPVDEEVEGLYTLDFLTGELQCFVVSTRTAAANKVTARFFANPAKDLGINASKKPNYLMVTGGWRASAGGGARPAQSIVYVVDTNTGKFVGYSFFWNQAAARSGKTQGSMVLVAGGAARRAIIE